MKRHLPAFFAASKASMAPPGANICSTSAIWFTPCICQRSTWSVFIVFRETFSSSSASFRVRFPLLVVRKMFFRNGGMALP